MSFSGYFGGYIVTVHKKECIGPSSMMCSMSFAFYLPKNFLYCFKLVSSDRSWEVLVARSMLVIFFSWNNFLSIDWLSFPSEHSLERSSEYFEAGGFSICQPSFAFLPTQWPLKDRNTSSVDELIQGITWKNPRLPLWYFRGMFTVPINFSMNT